MNWQMFYLISILMTSHAQSQENEASQNSQTDPNILIKDFAGDISSDQLSELLSNLPKGGKRKITLTRTLYGHGSEPRESQEFVTVKNDNQNDGLTVLQENVQDDLDNGGQKSLEKSTKLPMLVPNNDSEEKTLASWSQLSEHDVPDSNSVFGQFGIPSADGIDEPEPVQGHMSLANGNYVQDGSPNSVNNVGHVTPEEEIFDITKPLGNYLNERRERRMSGWNFKNGIRDIRYDDPYEREKFVPEHSYRRKCTNDAFLTIARMINRKHKSVVKDFLRLLILRIKRLINMALKNNGYIHLALLQPIMLGRGRENDFLVKESTTITRSEDNWVSGDIDYPPLVGPTVSKLVYDYITKNLIKNDLYYNGNADDVDNKNGLLVYLKRKYVNDRNKRVRSKWVDVNGVESHPIDIPRYHEHVTYPDYDGSKESDEYNSGHEIDQEHDETEFNLELNRDDIDTVGHDTYKLPKNRQNLDVLWDPSYQPVDYFENSDYLDNSPTQDEEFNEHQNNYKSNQINKMIYNWPPYVSRENILLQQKENPKIDSEKQFYDKLFASELANHSQNSNVIQNENQNNVLYTVLDETLPVDIESNKFTDLKAENPKGISKNKVGKNLDIIFKTIDRDHNMNVKVQSSKLDKINNKANTIINESKNENVKPFNDLEEKYVSPSADFLDKRIDLFTNLIKAPDRSVEMLNDDQNETNDDYNEDVIIQPQPSFMYNYKNKVRAYPDEYYDYSDDDFKYDVEYQSYNPTYDTYLKELYNNHVSNNRNNMAYEDFNTNTANEHVEEEKPYRLVQKPKFIYNANDDEPIPPCLIASINSGRVIVIRNDDLTEDGNVKENDRNSINQYYNNEGWEIPPSSSKSTRLHGINRPNAMHVNQYSVLDGKDNVFDNRYANYNHVRPSTRPSSHRWVKQRNFKTDQAKIKKGNKIPLKR